MKKIYSITIVIILLLLVPVFVSAVSNVKSDDLFRTSASAAYPVGDEYVGYYRAEFNMPSGTIWRAAAEIGEQGTLYVNGEEVEFLPDYLRRISNVYQYKMHTVNLEPYLDPGVTNSIAIYFRSDTQPMSRFQGKVTMTDGTVVVLDMAPRNSQTDLTWRRHSAEQDDWNQTGFDDSSWNTNLNPIKSWGRVAVARHERWPGYDGRLVLENPHSTEEHLFFNEDQDVRVNVIVPEGLDNSGTIHWSVEETIKNNDLSDGNDLHEYFSFVDNGAKSNPWQRTSDDSYVYELNLGSLSKGVYTLEIHLENGAGQTIETRLPEPFVVVREIPMSELNADEYIEGLNLEFEGEIDFTDPSNTDWIEARSNLPYGEYNHWPGVIDVTTPTIIDKGDGMVYRQTYPDNYALFSYQYTFDHPGDWYLMVLEYPDDARRWTGISITRTEEPPGFPNTADRTDNGAGVITGHKYPLTNEMQEYKWLHRADAGLHTIDIISLAYARSAAAKKIRIYRVNGYLPALKNNENDERKIGIMNENQLGIHMTFGIDDPGEIANPSQTMGMTYYNLNFSMLQRKTQRSLFNLDTMEHQVEYIRFMGQNYHAFGSYMYLREQRGGYDEPYPVKTATISSDLRDMSLRVFEANGIEALSIIEYSYHQPMKEEPELSFYGATPQTYRAITKDGNLGTQKMGVTSMTHPRGKEAFFFAMDQITDRYSKSPIWKGLYLATGPGFAAPLFDSDIKDIGAEENHDPLDMDYSDATIAAFEDDNPGINVPGSGSSRYQDRYNFLTSPSMRQTWIDWKANFVRNLVLELRDHIQNYRSDLIVMQGWYAYYPEVYYWLKDGTKTYTENMREFGMDPTLYTNDDDVWISRWMFPTEHNRQANIGLSFPSVTRLDFYTAGWEHQVSPEVIAAYETNNKRTVTLDEAWQERNIFYMEEYTDLSIWPIGRNIARFQARYKDDYHQETFAQAMIASDPQIVIHGWNDVATGIYHTQEMREFNKVYTSLPDEKFWPVLGTNFDTNLAIRELQYGGTYWFYVVNPGYWPATATIELDNINSVVDVASGQSISTSGGTLTFNLRPYGIKAFRASTNNGMIDRYWIDPIAEDDLEHMRTIIYLVQEIYPTISETLRPYILASGENLIINTAAQAEQDIANGEYAAAWAKLTDWEFWIIAYNKVLGTAQVAPRVRETQTGPLTMTFDGSSSMSYFGPIVSYEWDFGDGNTGTGRIVSHTYPSPGTYQVSLTVTTSEGVRGSFSDSNSEQIFVSDSGFIEGDVDGDEDVDIFDLVAVAVNFGRRSGFTYPRADTDTNGVIDIFDIVYVATRIP